MATNVEGKTNGCTFQWKIENISHCWLKKGERIESPSFIVNALKGTKWSLWVHPMGSFCGNDIYVHLYRVENCIGPDTIGVNFQLALIDKDGNILTEGSHSTQDFSKDCLCPYKTFSRETIFITKREAFLPDDTLTLQCTLWEKQKTPVKLKHIYARTVFKLNRTSFIWEIDEFSTLNTGVRNKFKDDLLDFDIVLNEGLDCEKRLVIECISFNDSIKYFSFKTSIIDSEGQNEDCGRHEFKTGDLKTGDLKTGILSTLLFIKKLMEKKSRYLPNDVLSLHCEYSYSTGTVLNQFCNYGIISPKVEVAVGERSKHPVEQEIKLVPVLASDLKSMYSDGIFSDAEIRTSSQTFPVHKNILSARSPVFRRMFSHDMKETNSGHVDITDLENDTVHRMLLYMYTDSLENLQLDSACELYAAAEKYEILSLRSRCSSFLKDNLIATKACDTLVLADLHQDDDLKSAVQDFIVSHGKEVFGSEEWKDFIDTNSKLAANVMYRKVFPE